MIIYRKHKIKTPKTENLNLIYLCLEGTPQGHIDIIIVAGTLK